MEYTLDNLKSLNSSQYDKCKQSALKRVKNRIGDKPERKYFVREYSNLINPLDIALLIVFLGALLISFQHIFDYVSSVAGTHYESMGFTTGIRLSEFWFVASQQIGALLMAESAMIAFFSYWRLDTHGKTGRAKYSHLLLWLALASAAYVLYINTFGVGLIFDPTSWLAPVVTIGVGFRIEQILSEHFIRQREIDGKYTQALSQWELATDDPTKHQDYLSILYTELWEYLTVKLTSNSQFQDAPSHFKLAAVQRELDRENWMKDIQPKPIEASNGQNGNFTQAVMVEPQAMTVHNGNGKH